MNFIDLLALFVIFMCLENQLWMGWGFYSPYLSAMIIFNIVSYITVNFDYKVKIKKWQIQPKRQILIFFNKIRRLSWWKFFLSIFYSKNRWSFRDISSKNKSFASSDHFGHHIITTHNQVVSNHRSTQYTSINRIFNIILSH